MFILCVLRTPLNLLGAFLTASHWYGPLIPYVGFWMVGEVVHDRSCFVVHEFR